MNENVPTPTQATSQESSAINSPNWLRLKFPIGVVLVSWVLHFVVSHLDQPYFYGFLFQMASAGLFTLLFLSWWWFNRGVRLSDKLFGFVLIVAEGRFGLGQVILLADQSLLLVISENGEVILLAADAQSQKEIGRFQALYGKTWNHPALTNGRLYLRNAEELACYVMEPPKHAAIQTARMTD